MQDFLLARRAANDAHIFFQQARKEFDEFPICLVVFWLCSNVNAECVFVNIPFHDFCLGSIGSNDDGERIFVRKIRKDIHSSPPTAHYPPPTAYRV